MNPQEYRELIDHFLDSILSSEYPGLHGELIDRLNENPEFRFDREENPKGTLISMILETINILENNSSDNYEIILERLNSVIDTNSGEPINKIEIILGDDTSDGLQVGLDELPNYAELISELEGIINDINNEE